MTIRHKTLGPCVAAIALLLGGCGGPSDTELTASAKTMLAAKDTKGAVIQLKNALQKNPQSAEARLLLGKALLETGDPVAALVELRKAQELQTPDDQVMPELARALQMTGEEGKLIAQFANVKLTDPAASGDLLTTLASSYASTGDLPKARETLQSALRVRPGYGPALILQSRMLAFDGDTDGALVVLDKVLVNEPGNESAGILKGELLHRGKKDLDAALAAFRAVLATNAKSVAAHTSVMTLLYEQTKPEEAKKQFVELKKAAPNHPETLYFEAQFAFESKDYKAVREITDRILKGLPDNVPVLELAGAAEYRLKNYLQAEAFLGRALKRAPGLLLSRHLLAQTYLRTGQPGKAIEALQPVLEGKSQDGTTLALAGEAWLQLGEPKKSEAAFQAAAKASPDDARVRTSVAMAQVARGNGGSAIAELEAIAAGDKSTRADLALVSARLRQGDTAGALKAIDGLEAKTPDAPLPHNLRGRVLLVKKDIPAATKSFEAALKKDPNYFPATASLAAIELSSGKPELARKRFEDVLKAQPKNSQVMLALAELGVRTGAAPSETLRWMHDAVKANPTEPTPRLTLITFLLNIGEAKSALTAAQEAVAALPNNLDLQDAMGRAQIANGDGNQAVSTYTKLAATQPTYAMHHVRMADGYALNKDYTNAGRSLRRALELQPNLPAAKGAQVALAMMDKRPDDAVKLSHELQKQDPKDPMGWVLEGEVETSRKNWVAAASAYRGALQRRAVADYAAKLHRSLIQSGNTAEAERVAADWKKNQPKDAIFPYYLGDQAMAQNKLAEAEAQYRAVLEIQPKNALALNNVAWLLVKQGKPGGVAMAEQATTLLPDRAPLLDTLATALAADKQYAKAIEAQKRAIVISPQDNSLKLALARHYLANGEKPQARAELEALEKLGDKFAGQAEVASLLKSL
jgi:putative PEP-CTERM system TPR-repeat lipoprotein